MNCPHQARAKNTHTLSSSVLQSFTRTNVHTCICGMYLRYIKDSDKVCLYYMLNLIGTNFNHVFFVVKGDKKFLTTFCPPMRYLYVGSPCYKFFIFIPCNKRDSAILVKLQGINLQSLFFLNLGWACKCNYLPQRNLKCPIHISYLFCACNGKYKFLKS